MASKVLTPVIDKNGVQTSRWKGTTAPSESARLKGVGIPSKAHKDAPHSAFTRDVSELADKLVDKLNSQRNEYDPTTIIVDNKDFYNANPEEYGVTEDDEVVVLGSENGPFVQAVAFGPDGIGRLVAKGYIFEDGADWEPVKQFCGNATDIRRASLQSLNLPTGYIVSGGSVEESGGSGPVSYTTVISGGNDLYKANGYSTSWVTRQTRTHIKEAVKAGLLPGDLTYRATTYHDTVRIEVIGDTHDSENDTFYSSNRQGIKDEINMLAHQYNWRMSDNIGEVNNVSYYVSVSFHED